MLSIQRVVFLMALILSVFAGMIWFEKGSPVFPYPLNDVFFFVATIIAIYIHPKPLARASIFGGIALIGLGTSIFLHETVLSYEQIELLYDSPVIDLLFLIKSLLLVICGFHLVQSYKRTTELLLLLIVISTTILYALNLIPIIAVYISLSLLAYSANKNNPFNYLLYLLVFLELSRHFTDFVN